MTSVMPGTGAVVTVRIMIAEDQTVVRQALVALLEMEDDISVVAQAASGGEAVAMAHRYQPDVAVLDVEMPDGDGLEVARRLGKEGYRACSVSAEIAPRPRCTVRDAVDCRRRCAGCQSAVVRTQRRPQANRVAARRDPAVG